MSVSQYCALAAETTYGTWVTPTRSFRDTGDDWTVVNEPVRIDDSYYVGQQGPLVQDHQNVLVGATGSINIGLADNGMGLILANLLGVATTPVAVTSTANNRFGRTYSTNGEGSGRSFSVARGRGRRSADLQTETVEEFRYAGSVPTGFEFSVSRGAPWMFMTSFDAQSESPNNAATAQIYTSVGTQRYFGWQHTGVTVGGTTLQEFESFNISGEFNMDVDYNTLNSSSNKLKPLRINRASFTGTLSGGYSANVQTNVYDIFRSGEAAALQVEAKFNPAGYTGADDHSRNIIRFMLPQVIFTGGTPSNPLGSRPTFEAPFEAFWDGNTANPLMSIYLQNAERTDS